MMIRIFPVELRHCVSPPTVILQSALKILKAFSNILDGWVTWGWGWLGYQL